MIRFRRLALLTAATTLTLVALGALVRATGAGLGCLDEWPTCHGGWIAPLQYHAMIEWSHRALAGVVVILVMSLALTSSFWTPPKARALRIWSWVALAAVLGQAALGRMVVVEHLHAAYVTAHLLLAMGLVAATVRLAAGAYVVERGPAHGDLKRPAGMAVGAMVGVLAVIVAGAYVREMGAGLAFGDWPLMDGGLLPALGGANTIHFLHRVAALVVLGHVIALALSSRRDPRSEVRTLAVAVAVTYGLQILVGGATVLARLAPVTVILHVAVGALTWGLVVALVVVARTAPGPAKPAPPPISPSGARGGRFRSYLALTKPRIIVLLLVTTVPAMILAAGRFPSLWLVAATLAGGMLTAGSANAMNQYLERDIDGKMRRTRNRPLPAHAVAPPRALAFGLALGVAGFAWLTVTVNLLAASLAVSAILFYVLIYTVLLKRSTPQNIVIGGAAGAAPVLVGWAAVTGTVGVEAWILFAIIFLWTPPHFWALAMHHREDYAAAGVPMLPVVRTTQETTLQILLYAVALLPITLLLYPVAGMGAVYAVAALGLGAGFVYLALRLRLQPDAAAAVRLFRYSISYLALLFAAIAADRLMA